MPYNLDYVAYQYGATIVEYQNTLYLCFLNSKDRDECQSVTNCHQFEPGYWEQLGCYTLRVQ